MPAVTLASCVVSIVLRLADVISSGTQEALGVAGHPDPEGPLKLGVRFAEAVATVKTRATTPTLKNRAKFMIFMLLNFLLGAANRSSATFRCILSVQSLTEVALQSNGFLLVFFCHPEHSSRLTVPVLPGFHRAFTVQARVRMDREARK